MGEIVVALFGLMGTLGGSYIANRKTAALTLYRLEQLEKKVDKHNSVIERTYELEKRMSVVDEEINEVNNRIHDLEADGK
jgi:hypothetical protein